MTRALKLVLCLLCLAAAACGDDSGGRLDGVVKSDGPRPEGGGGEGLLADAGIGLQPFVPAEMTLSVGQSYDVRVRLTRMSTSVVSVDVTNPAPQQVSVTPTTVTFQIAGYEQKATASALKSTGGQFVSLTFTIRGTSASQVFRLKVN